MIKNILLAFIPLFVAVDAIGVLPIFVSLTEKLEERERMSVIFQAVINKILDLKRTCPKCKRDQFVPPNRRNETVRCKHCGAEVPSPHGRS